MTLALAIVDNQDGSGATATVTGSLGAVVSAFVQSVQTGSGWASAGGRTGDGTFSISVAANYYWGYVSDASGISNFVYFPVTDNALAVHERSIQAIKARIQGLTLPGIPSGQVVDLIKSDTTLVPYLPCVTLAIDDAFETQPGTLNQMDDIGYPVWVSVCANIDVSQTALRAWLLLTRQTIFRALRQQPLMIPEIINVEITPRPIVTVTVPNQISFFASSLLARCISREPRGPLQ